jgi:ketosteroid isomerase-like protein
MTPRHEAVGDGTEDLLAANEAFYQAFNQKDAGLMDDLWANDASVSCIHPGWNLLEGREAVLGSWHNILGNPSQPRIVTGGATASIHGDLGIVICRELVAGSPLVATNVFVRAAGAWKLLHHHSGAVFNA